MGNEKLLDRYSLGEVLGLGGMGSVVQAHDDVLDRSVAIKFLKDEYANDVAVAERFRREARIAASLSHPGIAQVFDFQEDDGRKFIVMEHLQGDDLHTFLAKNGPMSPPDAARVITEAAAALGHAHEAGAVHRDVKPGNIFITDTGAVKVTDFGIALAKSQTAVTATGELLGTALYLSPEQIGGARATPMSDVYALGCVLFQALTGKPPYEGESQMAIAHAHTKAPIPSVREIDGSIPAEIDAVVQKALAKTPEDRYQSGSEMSLALREVIGNLDTAPVSVTPPVTEVIHTGPRTEIQHEAFESVPETPDRRRFRLPRQVLAVIILAIAVISVALMARSCAAGQTVPKVAGMTQQAAQEAIEAAGLTVGTVTPQSSNDVPEGIVISQNPRELAKVSRDTKVDLVISSGPEKVQVPDVRGQEVDEAEDSLRAAGFKVTIQTQEAKEELENKVISYTPEGSVPPGSNITLTIGTRMDDEKGKGRDRDEGD
jgi:serine/threonine protein kinase